MGVVPSGTRTSTFQLDVAHSGAQAADHIGVPLCERWSVPLKANVTQPVAGDGLVWVSAASAVTALDAATGSVVWGPVALGSVGRLAYDAGRLYTTAAFGGVRRLDGATGAVLWTSLLEGGIFGASPVARGDRVLLPNDPQNSQPAALGLDANSGKVVWSDVAPGGASSAALGDALGYFSWACGTTLAFDIATGAPAWVHAVGCTGDGNTPAVLANGVYVSGPSVKAVVLDPTSGAVTGTFAVDQAPAGAGDQGFFVNGALLQRISLGQSVATWTFDAGEKIVMPPLVLGTNVFAVTASGLLYAIDTASGLVVSSANVGEPLAKTYFSEVGMAAADGRLFVPTKTRFVAY